MLFFVVFLQGLDVEVNYNAGVHSLARPFEIRAYVPSIKLDRYVRIINRYPRLPPPPLSKAQKTTTMHTHVWHRSNR